MEIFFYRSSAGRSPVEDFIRSLTVADQAVFADVYSGITEFGLKFERVQFKPLDGKLWEIKFRAQGGGYRVAYVLVERGRMVWLHAFKKSSQRTPRQDLEAATKRMKEVLS